MVIDGVSCLFLGWYALLCSRETMNCQYFFVQPPVCCCHALLTASLILNLCIVSRSYSLCIVGNAQASPPHRGIRRLITWGKAALNICVVVTQSIQTAQLRHFKFFKEQKCQGQKCQLKKRWSHSHFLRPWWRWWARSTPKRKIKFITQQSYVEDLPVSQTERPSAKNEETYNVTLNK